MSRLWSRPRLCGYVGEDHLALCLVTGRRRPRVLQTATVALPAGHEGAIAAALEGWLAEIPPTRLLHGADLELRLGATLVRYLVLPWDPLMAEETLRHSMARALFTRQFQEPAAGYDVRFARAHYGRPQLAAFVSRELIRSVEAVAERHGLRLGLLEPLLAAVCRRFAKKLPRRGEAALLVAESSRLLKVQLVDGAVAGLQLRPLAPADLPLLIGRLAEAPAARIFAPLQPGLAGSLPAAWLALDGGDGFTMTGEGAYAYALCGVY